MVSAEYCAIAAAKHAAREGKREGRQDGVKRQRGEIVQAFIRIRRSMPLSSVGVASGSSQRRSLEVQVVPSTDCVHQKPVTDA
jgi:hypothetical protein